MVFVTVHTAGALTATDQPNELSWEVQPGKPWEASLDNLLDQLRRMWEATGQDDAKLDLDTEMIKQFCQLMPAKKASEGGAEYDGDIGAIITWEDDVKEDDVKEGTRFFLGASPQPEDEEEELPLDEADLVEPTLDEPPPHFEPGPHVQEVGTSAQDVPKYNEVLVTGTLPMQHLKVSALSWKPPVNKASEGLVTRPVSTATMCPSCGTPFAMSITKDHTKDRMLTPAMEAELNNALEAQRTVLEGEKDTLEAEVNDLRAALNSVNASLNRTREDGHELGQLKGQQDEWAKWLEEEIRQTKAEISQVSYDFDQCLKSNDNLEQAVELAIHKKVEERYYPERTPKNPPAQHAAATLPRPASMPSPLPNRHSSPALRRPGSPAGHSPYTPGHPNSKKARLKEIVTQYYRRHKPEKLEFVDALVDEYTGRERDLLNLMARKYGDVSILGYDPILDEHLDNQPSAPQSYSRNAKSPDEAASEARMRGLLDSIMSKPGGPGNSGGGPPPRGGYAHPPSTFHPRQHGAGGNLPPPTDSYQPGFGGGPYGAPPQHPTDYPSASHAPPPPRGVLPPPSRYGALDDEIRAIAPHSFDRLAGGQPAYR